MHKPRGRKKEMSEQSLRADPLGQVINTSIRSNSVGLEAGLFIDNIEVVGVAASSW